MATGKALNAIDEIVSLTYSGGGATSNTLDDSTTSVEDDLAALCTKVNELVAAVNSLSADFKRFGQMDRA